MMHRSILVMPRREGKCQRGTPGPVTWLNTGIEPGLMVHSYSVVSVVPSRPWTFFFIFPLISFRCSAALLPSMDCCEPILQVLHINFGVEYRTNSLVYYLVIYVPVVGTVD